nr:galactitol-1-phosphate 5-dehydrogenase [Deinococcota bacterium]
VGIEVTRQKALTHLVAGGSAIMLGLHDDAHTYSFYPLLLQERCLQGSYTYTDADFRQAVALARELPENFALKQPLTTGPEAFEALAEGSTSHLKLLLEPQKTRQQAT